MENILLEMEEFLKYDRYATLEGFEEVCKIAGNLREQEIQVLLKKVQGCPSKRIRSWRVRQYLYEDLYHVFISNPIARILCEKQKFFCWEDLVFRYIDKTETQRVNFIAWHLDYLFYGTGDWDYEEDDQLF